MMSSGVVASKSRPWAAYVAHRLDVCRVTTHAVTKKMVVGSVNPDRAPCRILMDSLRYHVVVFNTVLDAHEAFPLLQPRHDFVKPLIGSSILSPGTNKIKDLGRSNQAPNQHYYYPVMSLSMRNTGLSSLAYADSFDCVINEGGRVVGRIYEDRHALPELHWYWSLTNLGACHAGIPTSGRAPTLDEAKAQFQAKSALTASGHLQRVGNY